MLVVTLVLGVASIVAVYWGARAAMGFGRDLRSAIFRKVESFSQVEMQLFGPASLITRNTNDVQQVQTVVFLGLTIMVSAPIVAIGGIILAVRQDGPLSLLLVVILPIMAGFIGVMMYRAIPLFRAMQTKLDRINQVMRETLAGVRVIRAFVRTDHEERRFDEANLDLFDTSLQVNRLFAVTIPVLTLIINLSTVASMWFGAIRVDSGADADRQPDRVPPVPLQILFSVLTAVFMFILVPRAAVSAGRIREVLDTEPTHPRSHARRSLCQRPISTPAAAVGSSSATSTSATRAPRTPVLHDITFEAVPGQTTAIVGRTGSGKSTLVNLLPRLYDATEGAVLVDGVDVRDIDRDDLWRTSGSSPRSRSCSAAPSPATCATATRTRPTTSCGTPSTSPRARDFVEAMEGGLEAPISQGGANLSGGQRQRLAIARALVKRAGIFVFDDSFSALDFGTDARLRAALERELGWATVIIVAQRVGTIMQADQILVMDDGRIVGIGTHSELLESNETYREIVYSQLSAEEAAA